MHSGSLDSRLAAILVDDPIRRRCLEVAHEVCAGVGVGQYLLAAGFVRNAVWDYLHEQSPAALNDVDLIYMGPQISAQAAQKDSDWLTQAREVERYICSALSERMPEVNWEVRDQRRMHLKHGDAPYTNLPEAMAAWPEKETAIGVRHAADGQLDVVSSWGLESLFALKLTPSAAHKLHSFQQRVHSKQWLQRYPRLSLS
ncbi:nucleotidyltransferase family protein [Shewanella sp.]|uniref:nucleotidyltransferase family protein n=1 Tax=Shewanella sp. TaxID=50422 RepID=UPI00356A069A